MARPSEPEPRRPNGSARWVGAIVVPGWDSTSASTERLVAAAWAGTTSVPEGRSGCGICTGWLKVSPVRIALALRECRRTIW